MYVPGHILQVGCCAKPEAAAVPMKALTRISFFTSTSPDFGLFCPRISFREVTMLSPARRLPVAAAAGAAFTLAAAVLQAQTSSHPYRVNPNCNKPVGRKIGVASGIKMDRDGRHMWILDRCGANGCAESDLDPIIKMDPDGKIVASFGKGLLNFPHGFFIDRDGNVWV